MKLLLRILIFSSILMSSVTAQTSNRYFTSFDSGNAEGWGFYTGAEVFVQNGFLNLYQNSDWETAAQITPPIGATVNDFTIAYKVGANSTNRGGFIGRIGFNSFIGIVFEEDTMSVVYATNVTSYENPDFQILYTGHTHEYTLKGGFEVVKSGANLNVKASLNDTVVYNGTVVNAPQVLLSGQIACVLFGDNQYQFFLDEIEILYNPYIQSNSGTYNEDFSNTTPPWLKFGFWNDVAGAINISGGKLNIRYFNTAYTSLYVASPIGAVENFDMTLTGTGDMHNGSFGMYRIHDYEGYTGLIVEDSLKLVYGITRNGPPAIISTAAFNPGDIAVIRLIMQNNGNNIAMTVYINNVLTLTGNLTAPDSRYLSGHLCFGIEAEDTADMYFDDISIVYNKYTTDAREDNLPVNTFSLSRNYPNPFNPSTNIKFTLSEPAKVKLAVYDAAGKYITTLNDDFLSEGTHSVIFDAKGLASGVYFYRLQAGKHSETGKMTLMK